MEYEELGKSGIKVPRLCIGTWQAAGWTTSKEESFVETIKFALDMGLTFIDTAEGYGNGLSEQLIAKAIEGKRDSVVIASKFNHTNSSPEKLRQALTNSLRNLKTDYIDLYQQHWPPKQPPLDETLGELQKLKEEGKIRSLGVSNWMEPEWEEATDISTIDTLQPCYSLLWRSIEPKVLPLCKENNISILPYSPLCQSLLARRMEAIPNDHRTKNIVFEKSIESVLALLENIAEKNAKTLPQISLRWLLDTPGVTAPIVGSSSKKQLEENLGALNWKLHSADYDALDKATKSLSAGLLPHDTLWGWHPRGR